MRRGSVPEIVEDGVTGFIVNTDEETVAAIGRLPELARKKVRAESERRFTARRMAESYIHHYERLLRARLVQQQQQPSKNRRFHLGLF